MAVLTAEEKIYLASVALAKGYDYETMRYSDYMHGKEGETDGVWDYVDEAEEIGRAAFREKYSENKLHPGF